MRFFRAELEQVRIDVLKLTKKAYDLHGNII